MSIVTLLTDFGTTDYYVAAVKGVILSRAPGVTLADVSHDGTAGDVEEGAFLLGAAWRWYPPGTVHLVVVDPGVGSERRILAVARPEGFFVGPDNGVLSPVLPGFPGTPPGPAGEDGRVRVYAVDRPDLYLDSPGDTFHGRDRFAPVAAFLAAGGAAEELGPEIDDFLTLPAAAPSRRGDALEGRILHVDRFGNLVTDLPSPWLKRSARSVRLTLRERPSPAAEGSERTYADREIAPLARLGGNTRTLRCVTHYSELARGEAGILPGSLGTLELSLNGDSLARRWQLHRGARVRLHVGDSSGSGESFSAEAHS